MKIDRRLVFTAAITFSAFLSFAVSARFITHQAKEAARSGEIDATQAKQDVEFQELEYRLVAIEAGIENVRARLAAREATFAIGAGGRDASALTIRGQSPGIDDGASANILK
jgi:hypothetical protein